MANYIDIKNSYDILWQSTIQTGNFNATSGKGYFINTTSAAITMTLPSSPSSGDFVAVKDYARTFGTNKLIIDPNGGKIQGDPANSALDQNGDTAVLVYIDSTKGWLYTQENTVTPVSNAEYVVASGGTETTCGDYKIHTFNSSGTFTVTSAGNCAGSNTVDYMVIAGGAAGGTYYGGGGGGAGGFRESVPVPGAWSASPKANPGGALPVSVTAYPVTVGGGGSPRPSSAGNYAPGDAGSPSIFSTITSAGGGGGNCVNNPFTGAGAGGSGGGTFGSNNPVCAGGSGNSPPTSPPQGNPGGTMRAPVPEPGKIGSGGGGATAAGALGGGAAPLGGPGAGGAGATTSITGSSVSYAGGGGGGGVPGLNNRGLGGTGGGGNGGPGSPSTAGTPGSTNTGGGGGGGGGAPSSSGAGGSGKVVIRYKFQN